jgi:hypothetical protein
MFRTILNRWTAAAAVVWVLALVGGPVVSSGQNAPAKPAKAAPPANQDAEARADDTAKPKPRLPAHFGEVLDDQQRDKARDVQEKYAERLAAARKQLKDLVDQRDAELDAILTAEQRAKVAALREAAKARRAANRKAPVTATSALPADKGAADKAALEK